eukprot:TRINITY_DN74218_c0_g1_i1.p1 TRINITY_DN74218_c0_g1~~TRINITY_DN74218_c0_g1_i1.p1  ORF type:complete len:439 (+),score=85.43 TRINITY_DN74218_c0_g1_i1:142-1458(+)
MSFRELDGHSGGRLQAKQRRDDDSLHEKNIKANIQAFQDGLRRASEQLDQGRRGLTSKRLASGLDTLVIRNQELKLSTDELFREWNTQLNTAPSERQKKRFSFEKLKKAYDHEVERFSDMSAEAAAFQQEARRSPAAEERRTSGAATNLDVAGTAAEEQTSLMESPAESGTVSQHVESDITLRNRIAQEREEGIRRIQHQMQEVNAVYRDLASIVHEQGQYVESIENSADCAAKATKQAVHELNKASDKARGARERLCCVLVAVVLLLVFVLLPHLHIGLVSHDAEVKPLCSQGGCKEIPGLRGADAGAPESASSGHASSARPLATSTIIREGGRRPLRSAELLQRSAQTSLAVSPPEVDVAVRPDTSLLQTDEAGAASRDRRSIKQTLEATAAPISASSQRHALAGDTDSRSSHGVAEGAPGPAEAIVSKAAENHLT